MPYSYLAVDVGGGSGRGIVGTLDGRRLKLKEIRRFENRYVSVAGKDYWNTLQLFREMIRCVDEAQEQYPDLSSFCVDTWGADFALLDRNGQPAGYSWCTRNSGGAAAEAFFKEVMSPERFVAQTGSQIRLGNTPFQLYERILEQDPALAGADRFLMLPDYFGYLFTGQKYNEFTVATTSQMISPGTGTWNKAMIEALGLPERLFGELILPGTVRYDVLPEVLPRGAGSVNYVPVATHDTASAVAAIAPASDEIFLSSGTWSIIGVKCDKPIINDEVYRYGFSNEGTEDGRWRLQKDVMGMWCMQKIFRDYNLRAPALTWDGIVEQAKAAPAMRSFVDLTEPSFARDVDAADAVKAYCKRTCQPVPGTLGELSRCIYESMALQYKATVGQLKELSGRTPKRIRIVGGGGKNNFLNQMTADATGIPVAAGPYEGACIGNILMQAAAQGVVKRGDFPEILRESFERKIFLPKQDSFGRWEAAMEKYLAFSRKTY